MISLQESRLFKIIYYLLNKGQATASELAEKLEVSVRTIYRDIDMISSAGIPIYVTTGRNGGVKLYDNFILNKALLSKKDIQDILIGMQSLSATQYPDYNTTLEKLNAIFKQPTTNWIDVDFSHWGSITQKEKQIFTLLKTAVLNHREVNFHYYNSSGNKSERKCRPLKLLYKDKAWYLFGFCCTRNDYRIFRISRIRNLILKETVFNMILDRDIPTYPLPESIGELIEIELHFPLNMAHRVFDIFSEEAINKKEKYFVVKTNIPLSEWLYEFIMSFGSNVDIIKPLTLKKEIVRRYKKALLHHKEER